MQADFSARHKFEMFYRVGDVDFPAVNAAFFHAAVERQPCRSHEWLAGKVFLVAGLFADQHHLGMLRAFAEYGLCRVFPEMTGTAMRCLLAQDLEARGRHA